MKNWRNVAGAIHRPSGPVAVANSPMMNEPETLTNRVPQGNVSPTLFAINPEQPQRARLPSPPPIKTHSAFHIIPNPPQFSGVVRSYQHLNLPFPGTLSRTSLK